MPVPNEATTALPYDANNRYVQGLWNGSAYMQPRSNLPLSILASAARVANPGNTDQLNPNGAGVQVVIDVTAQAGGSITVTITGKDPVSGKYYTLLASAAITTISTTVLRVGPGLLAAANLIANDMLPYTWQIQVVHNNGSSITYSIGANVVNF